MFKAIQKVQQSRAKEGRKVLAQGGQNIFTHVIVTTFFNGNNDVKVDKVDGCKKNIQISRGRP